ncbi:MAG: hypothetical protein ACKPHU_25235 [Planctomycetaceae bacterium]
MKSVLAAVICAWLAVMLEVSGTGLIPRGALFLPVICAVFTWQPGVRPLLIGGILLLLDWIARPTLLPAVPLLLPFAVLLIVPHDARRRYGVRRMLRLPAPLQIPLLTVIATGLQCLAGVSYPALPNSEELRLLVSHSLLPLLLVALPVSAVLALLLRLAEETGLRRPFLSELQRI